MQFSRQNSRPQDPFSAAWLQTQGPTKIQRRIIKDGPRRAEDTTWTFLLPHAANDSGGDEHKLTFFPFISSSF
jgi:hypothetical protein